MKFKSVLTVVTEPTQAEHTVTAAAKLALANDGHLDVLALGMDMDLPGYGYIGGEAVVTT